MLQFIHIRTACLAILVAVLFNSTSPAATYRILTGDATAINSNWTATEKGETYAFSINGTPTKPWISPERFAGNYSVGIQVPTNNTGDTERFEYKILQAADTNGLHFDYARYSGFAFKLGSNAAPFLSSAIFWQAWQGSPWGPPAMLKFAADSAPPYRIRFTIRNMITGPDSAISDMELWSSHIIQPDTWYSVVVYIRPRYDTNGNIKLWINGTNFINWSGQIGYDPAQVAGTMNGLDIKNGIYQPDANNGHTLYFDQIKTADTYAEAVPAPYTNIPTLSPLTRTNNEWNLKINGQAGATYIIQASTNLVNWVTLANTNSPTMPFNFFDTAPGLPRRFYRATAEP